MFNMFGTKYDFKDPSRIENKFRKSKASFSVSIKIETHLFGVSLSEFSDSALLGKFRIKSQKMFLLVILFVLLSEQGQEVL
jgi:hypothetical protein